MVCFALRLSFTQRAFSRVIAGARLFEFFLAHAQRLAEIAQGTMPLEFECPNGLLQGPLAVRLSKGGDGRLG